MEHKVLFNTAELRRALENAGHVVAKVPKDRPILYHVKVTVPGLGEGTMAKFEAIDSYLLFRQEATTLTQFDAPRSDDGWAFAIERGTVKSIVQNLKGKGYDTVEFTFHDGGFTYKVGSQHWSHSDDWKYAVEMWPNTDLIVNAFEPGDAARLNVNSKVLDRIVKIRGASWSMRTGEKFTFHPAKDFLFKPFKVTVGSDVVLYVMPQRES